MGKYSDHLMSSKVVSPDNKIVLIDEKKYISEKPTTFTFNYNNVATIKQYEILDRNGKEPFIIKKNSSHLYNIYDLNDKCLLKFKEGFTDGKLLIEKGENEEEKLVNIKSRNIISHEYRAEFLNKFTGKDEILNIHYSTSFTTIGVFYGNEEEGAPLICRMHLTEKGKTRFLYKGCQYTIEIAPNVDILYLIAVSLFILRKPIKDDKSDVDLNISLRR